MHAFSRHTLSEKLQPLGKSQLDKPNSKTGAQRTDILAKLIKDKKPLELTKGGTIVVADIEDALQKIEIFKKVPSNFTLMATDGKAYPISQLGKSKVFGGGIGGAGSGTKDTKRNEGHNACMFRAYVDNPGHTLEYYDDSIIAQAYKDNGPKNIDATTASIMSTPEDWWQSSYNLTVAAYKAGYIHKNHVFHRGSAEMILLYKIKNVAYKNNGFKSLKDDKWNPGDVWAIEKGFDLKKELDYESVGALNRSILKHFVDRRLVGLSLKGPMVKPNPPMKEFNIIYPPDIDLHKLKGVYLSSKGGNFWSSKSAQWHYDTGVLNAKDNAAGDSIKAEIKGKKARGGGIAYGLMIEYIKRETGKTLKAHAKFIKPTAKKIAAEVLLPKNKHKLIKKEWLPLFNYFEKSTKYEDMIEEMKKKDWTWISAKFALMLVSYQIAQSGKGDALITHFVNYAGSQLTDSSTYVKLGK